MRLPRPSALLASLARPSLVRRLVLLAAAWSLGVLAIAGFLLATLFGQLATRRFDDTLTPTIDWMLATAVVADGRLITEVSTDPRFSKSYSGSYWQVEMTGAGGGQLSRSRSLWDHKLTLPPGGLEALKKTPGDNVFFDTPGPQNTPLRLVAVLVQVDEVSPPMIFMVAADRRPLNRDVRTFDTTIAVALILLGAGLISAVVVQVRVGLRPLFALRREVAAIRAGQTERIAGRYPTELEPLAEELNALLAHTQEFVERQRTHVGNLAHALKTPLSVMLTEAEQQPGPLAEVVTRQAQTMGQHVDHHLRRARAAARTQGQGERTQLAPVIEDLSRTLEKIFRNKLAEIEWDCPEDLHFLGERQDLLEMVGNVLENACKWSASAVRVTARADGVRRLAVIVEDDGPGLPAEKRAEVLRRGARLDEATPGSGLGLSIVDELARAYGGSVQLGESDLGGLKAVLILPRADA